MVSKQHPIVNWNFEASESFRKAYKHIHKESYANAQLVKTGITDIIDSLKEHPEKFP